MSPDTGEIRKLERGEALPEGKIGLHVGKLFQLVDPSNGLAVLVKVLSHGRGAIVVKPVPASMLAQVPR